LGIKSSRPQFFKYIFSYFLYGPHMSCGLFSLVLCALKEAYLTDHLIRAVNQRPPCRSVLSVLISGKSFSDSVGLERWVHSATGLRCERIDRAISPRPPTSRISINSVLKSDARWK
jgi:hypothetical protein